jgi:hypothetical protein
VHQLVNKKIVYSQTNFDPEIFKMKVPVYNALTPPIILYEREIWALRKKKNKRRFTSIEIKFFGRTAR